MKYIIKNSLTFLSIFIFCFFSYSLVVLADDSVIYYGGSGAATGGGGGAPGSTNSFYGFLGYRITLVDKTGQKVDGTRSVDVINPLLVNSYIQNDQAIQVNYYNGLGNVNYLFYPNYKYRFGENSSSDYIMIAANIVPFSNRAYNIAAHEQFVDDYIIDYKNNNIFCPSSWGSSKSCEDKNKIDFISLILYYSNFFKGKSEEPKRFSIALRDDKKLKDYYFSIELLVGGGGFNVFQRYGTATEMLDYMLSGNIYSTDYRDNMAVEKLNFACGLYTTKSFKTNNSDFTGFENYFDSFEECLENSLVSNNQLWTGNAKIGDWVNGSCIHPYHLNFSNNIVAASQNWGSGAHMENLKKFQETKAKNASGVAMISLNIDNDQPKHGASSNLNLCYNNTVSFSIKSPSSVSPFYKDFFKNNLFTDDESSFYCKDNVTYYLGDTINSLGGDKLLNTKIEVAPITAKIKRNCYGNAKDYSIINDLKLNYNKNIKVNVYGNDYEFVPDLKNIVKEKTDYVIKYKLSTPITLSNFDRKEETLTGYIDFSNYKDMFGASNTFLKKISDSGSEVCKDDDFITLANVNNVTFSNCFSDSNEYYGLSVIDKSSDGKCTFNYKVKEEPDTKYVFRVISLDNPFPARDGTSRLPGLNWLNEDENNVFDYITNNRGIRYVAQSNDVSPEQIYNYAPYGLKKISPMYEITLTPSNMINIRNYNKTHNYDSMYTGKRDERLICNEGRECFSQFLRVKDYASKREGNCFSYSKTEPLKNISINVSSDSIYNKLQEETITYNKDYDLNKNYRIDYGDYRVAKYYEIIGKNPKFYACANKTIFSGGPIEGWN